MKRSTKETVRSKAMKIAIAYETAYRTARTVEQTRRVITAIHQEITGFEVCDASVREVTVKFLDMKKGEVASTTMSLYRTATDHFLAHLGAKADESISKIERADLVSFRNHEHKSVSSTTVNHRLKCLRMIFRFAVEDGLIFDNPASLVKSTKADAPKEKRVFTKAELRLALDSADPEWKSMIYFGLYTGQRLADIASILWGNIDLQSRTISLRTRKTGRRQVIPIAKSLFDWIDHNLVVQPSDSPVHPQAFNTLSVEGRSGSLSRQFGDFLGRVGLREDRSHQKRTDRKGVKDRKSGLSFHCLRHTATTWLHEAGVPGAVAQKLIGHDSEAIHEVYVNVGSEALQAAVQKLPEI